jgi:hypothetical protein
MMQFTDKLMKNSALVYDLRMIVDGDARFYILKVHPAKHTAFLHAMKTKQAYTLEDFAEIIERGWDEPCEELKAELHEKYGMYQSIVDIH